MRRTSIEDDEVHGPLVALPPVAPPLAGDREEKEEEVAPPSGGGSARRGLEPRPNRMCRAMPQLAAVARLPMPLAHAERFNGHGDETREAQGQAGKQLRGGSAEHLSVCHCCCGFCCCAPPAPTPAMEM